MSHVQIPVKVNRKDILPLAQHVLRTILTRKATEQEKIFVKLDECFSEENTNGINSGLQEYVSLMAEVAQEIAFASEILTYHKVWGSGVDIESSSDTEVLEDLPDLEEDGLRIDSRSVEPVAITSDHSEE